MREQGRKYRSRAFTVTYASIELEFPPRVAFALGRHLGVAVRRNRLRRQLKEIVASGRTPGGFYLIRPSPAAMNMNFLELRLAFDELLVKIDDSK